MRLLKDTNPGAQAVRVQCVHPRHTTTSGIYGKDRRLADSYADLDGRPFVDYYCDDCVRLPSNGLQQFIITREEL